MSWPHWSSSRVSCCFEKSQWEAWVFKPFYEWLIHHLVFKIIQESVEMVLFRRVFFFPPTPLKCAHPNHNGLLVTIHCRASCSWVFSELLICGLMYHFLTPSQSHPYCLINVSADKCSPWEIVGDQNQLKHLLAVQLIIHLYIEEEVMVPRFGDTIPTSITETSPKDEVEIKVLLKRYIAFILTSLEIMGIDFKGFICYGLHLSWMR